VHGDYTVWELLSHVVTALESKLSRQVHSTGHEARSDFVKQHTYTDFLIALLCLREVHAYSRQIIMACGNVLYCNIWSWLEQQIAAQKLQPY